MASSPSVMCCGLSCMDIELQSCDVPPSRESVVEFRGTSSIPGGSAPQTSRSLAALGVDVALVTAVGDDARGGELRSRTELDGRVQVFTVVTSRPTGVAFLPLFKDGTRACFVDLGANLVAEPDLLMPAERLATLSHLKVFHFGYPHLMPLLQGTALRNLFDKVRNAAPQALITLDLNGAKASEAEKPVLTAVLPVVAAVHANVDEACVISGLFSAQRTDVLAVTDIRLLVQWLTDRGAGIALITCGRNGVFAGTGKDVSHSLKLSSEIKSSAFIYRPAYAIISGKPVKASGAGDAFTAGVITELARSRGGTGLQRIADAGLASALYRIDPTLSSTNPTDLETILKLAAERPRIQPSCILQVDKYADKTLRYTE